MDKIKKQAGIVGQLLGSAETWTTYRKTLTLTWDILRETGILLWLVICLVFVGAEFFWKFSISLGTRARAQYESFTKPSEEEPKSATEIGQSMASSLSYGTANLLYQAKQQLGMSADQPVPPARKPPKPKAIAPKEEPAASSQAESAASTAPEAKAAVAAAAAKVKENGISKGDGDEEE